MHLSRVALLDGFAVNFREPVVVSTRFERSSPITNAEIRDGDLWAVIPGTNGNEPRGIGPLSLPVKRCEGCGVAMLLMVHRERYRGTRHLGERRFCTAACRERARRAVLSVTRPTVTCASCGRDFQPKRRDARTCSTRCRVALHRSSAMHV